MFVALLSAASSLIACDVTPVAGTVNLCWAETGCHDQDYGYTCFNTVLPKLTDAHPIVNVYVGMPGLQLVTSYIRGRTLNLHNLSNGFIYAANLTLGGTLPTAVLTSEIPLQVGLASQDADFARITLNRAGNFVAQNYSRPALRVNDIAFQGAVAGAAFGGDAFRSVTIRNGGYPTLTQFGVAATRHSGTWVLAPTTAFAAAGDHIAPQRIALSGFSERTRLTLTATGLKVELLNSRVTQVFVDYLRAGFTVTYNTSVDLLEIATDGTFAATTSVLGGAYLEIVTALARPRIVVLAGAYPVGNNVHITSTGNSPDFVVNAADAGLSLTVTTSARLYLGSVITRFRSFAGNDITTIRFVSNVGAITVYVGEVSFASAARHFLSDDNGDVTLVIGGLAYTVTGLSSDGHVSARGTFRFSGGGHALPAENVTNALVESYVAADAPFKSLDVANRAIIRVPVGQTFFVNSSHTFPGTHYFLSVQGTELPAHRADGANKHAVLCGPALLCSKFEVVFKNDPYYTNPTAYVRLGTELAEEKCFNYSTLFTPFHGDAAAGQLRCVGYEVLAAKRTAVAPQISYSALGQGESSRAVWADHIYDGVREVTVAGGALAAGIAVNIDSSALRGANLTLGPPGVTNAAVYFDSTARTPGHLHTLNVNSQLQVLGVELTGLTLGAPHVNFLVAQQRLDFARLNLSGLASITVPYADFAAVATATAAVKSVTVTGFQSAATGVTFAADGLELLLPTGRQTVTRHAGSSLTLTGWALPGPLSLTRGAPITQHYNISLLPPVTAPSVDLTFLDDWREPDAGNVTVQAANISLSLGSSNPLTANLVTSGIHFTLGWGPANFRFAGTVTTGTGNFALTDASQDTPTVFDHLIWNAASFTHRCHRLIDNVIVTNCARVVVRKLTVLNGFQFPADANITFGTVTISGSGLVRVAPRQFNASHYTIRVPRSGGPTLLLTDNETNVTVPPPAVGEIEAVAGPESGDDILARTAAAVPDFPAPTPAFRHLVCGTKFNCAAWLAAFQASAAKVRTWDNGATSTFTLRCSATNPDIAYQIGDYYKAGSRVENGTFVAWGCLDYHEAIVGGTAASPHADFGEGGNVTPPAKKKKLSGGAIAGIIIGVIAAVLAIGGVLYFCCFRKPKAPGGYEAPPESA